MWSAHLAVVALMSTALAVSVGCSEDDCTITLTCPRRAEGGGGTATSAGGDTSAGGTGATGGTTGEGATGGSGGAGGSAPSYVATAVTAGEHHTCALLDDGRIACWGNNDDGQLGDGTFASSQAPVLVAAIDDAVALDAGRRHTCALRSDDTVWCWGDNETRQIVDSLSDAGEPVATGIADLGAAAAGAGHTCTFVNGSGAKCWGAHGSGQLGNGGPMSAVIATPQDVETLTDLVDIAAGALHSCAIISNGLRVYCWGDNANYQLGRTTPASSSSPLTVGLHLSAGPTLVGEGLAVSDNSGCVQLTGEVLCWGDNDLGQLGDGSTTDYYAGKKIDGLDNVQELAAGGDHFCARRQNGTALCWGANSHGQVGDGTNGNNRLAPVEVDTLAGASHIGAGARHTCAVIAGGAVVCWGDNDEGQLGTGDTNLSNIPIAVPSFP